MFKITNKRKIIILIISLIVVLLIILYVINIRKNEINNTEEANIDINIYQFKSFKYLVPEGLKYVDYDNNYFKIQDDNWYALIKIYYDDNKNVFKNSELFINSIKYKEKNVINNYFLDIDDNKIITFNLINPNSILCYFATDGLFDYEVRIFNNDNSYKTDALNKIIYSLLTPLPSVDNGEEEFYEYEVMNFNNNVKDD